MCNQGSRDLQLFITSGNMLLGQCMERALFLQILTEMLSLSAVYILLPKVSIFNCTLFYVRFYCVMNVLHGALSVHDLSVCYTTHNQS